MSDGSDGIVLQPLRPFDLPVAAALHAGCFDSAWNEAAMAEVVTMPGSFGALAHVGDQPAGLVIVLAVGAEAEILTLGVLPRFRRRGVATRLFAWAADRLSGSGCQRLLLEVAEDNAPARALYGKLGFERIGRRPSYYRRPAGTEAAVVLARTLYQRER